MNAVVDALDHAGLGRAAETLQMPATPERVWQMLRAGRLSEAKDLARRRLGSARIGNERRERIGLARRRPRRAG